MKLPQIQIESQFIRHTTQTIKPIQEIEQTDATLDVKQATIKLNIDRIPGTLTIDQNQAWAEMDLKSVFERTEEAAQIGHQAWLEGLARESQEGDAMMKIHQKGNPVADQAITNSVQRPFETNIGWIPSYGSVKINFIPTEININWDMAPVRGEFTPGNIAHNYTPGKVEGEIEKWNTLKIDFTNLYV